VPTYAQILAADAPLAAWSLGDSGTTAADLSGNGHAGTYSGTYTHGQTSLTPADATAATLFAGGHAVVPNWSGLNFGTGDFTWECRLRTSAEALQVAFGPGWWVGTTAAGHLAAGIDGGLVDSGHVVNDGATHHVAVRRSGETVTFWADGVVVSTQTNAGACNAGGNDLWIGDLVGDGVPFDGTIQYVAVYNTALADARLQTRDGHVAPDAAGVLLSPYNSEVTAGVLRWRNGGAYARFSFTGTSAAVKIDVSGLSGASVASGSYPVLRATVDDRPLADVQLAAGQTLVTLASGLSAGTHNVELAVVALDPYTGGQSLWDGAYDVRVTGWRLDPGQAVAAPAGGYAARTRRMVVVGDSLTCGVFAKSAASHAAGDDGTLSHVPPLAAALSAEYGAIGLGGQGYSQAGLCGVPAAPAAFGYHRAGVTRLSAGLLSPAPDYVVLAHGTAEGADGAADADVAAGVASLLTAARAAAPDATILVLVPPGGWCRGGILAGVATYRTASGDGAAYPIDCGTALQRGLTSAVGTPSQQSADGRHPYAAVQAVWGGQVAGQVAATAGALAVLLARLTDARAGYLDNLSGGAIAQQATLTTVDGATAAIKAKTDNLPSDPAGVSDLADLATAEDVTLVVTPIVASTTNPRYATRDLPPIAQGSEPTDAWTIVDGTGAPVDLTGKTLRLVAYTVADADAITDPFAAPVAAAFKYETGGDGITLGGTGHNVVSVTHDQTKTATAGTYRYWLLNPTDRLPLARGKLPIQPALWDTE
jgi:hypothetical protein